MHALIAWCRAFPFEVLALTYVVAVVGLYGGHPEKALTLAPLLHLVALVGILKARRYRSRTDQLTKDLAAARQRLVQSKANGSSDPYRFNNVLYARTELTPAALEENVEYKALLLSFLSNQFPSGQRWEEVDGEPGHYAWHLYVDLPRNLDLPGHQLRFRLNDHEAMHLKSLDVYDKVRTAGTAEDTQHLLTFFVQTSDLKVLTQPTIVPTAVMEETAHET